MFNAVFIVKREIDLNVHLRTLYHTVGKLQAIEKYSLDKSTK